MDWGEDRARNGLYLAFKDRNDPDNWRKGEAVWGAGEERQRQRERIAWGMAGWDGQTNLQSEMTD